MHGFEVGLSKVEYESDVMFVFVYIIKYRIELKYFVDIYKNNEDLGITIIEDD